MNAVQLLRDQFKWAHESLENTVGDLTQEGSDFNNLGKAIPAGAAYAHAVLSEDILLGMFSSQKPVYSSAAAIGLSEAMPGMDKWDQHEKWYKTVKVDIKKFREYAKKVYKATDEYIATLGDEDLNKEFEMAGMGKNTIAFYLSNFFVLHIANLTGEISAAKGVQGLKGYPW